MTKDSGSFDRDDGRRQLREKDRLAGETTPEEDKLLSQAIRNAVQGVM